MIDYRSIPRYRAYLLRLWAVQTQDPGTPAIWRFSLEDPRTGKRRGFAHLEELTAFLSAQMQEEES
jgi:hypothetical protein